MGAGNYAPPCIGLLSENETFAALIYSKPVSSWSIVHSQSGVRRLCYILLRTDFVNVGQSRLSGFSLGAFIKINVCWNIQQARLFLICRPSTFVLSALVFSTFCLWCRSFIVILNQKIFPLARRALLSCVTSALRGHWRNLVKFTPTM